MIIEKLIWDTEFFGIKVGRIILDEPDNFDVISFEKQVNDDKFELVYIVCLKELLAVENNAKNKFNLMDVQISMSKKFNSSNYTGIPYEFRTELSDLELQECYHIAEQIASVSRFYKEPLIGPEKTKELYRKWVDNALNKEHSDGVFLFRNNSEIVGIHIVKSDFDSKIGYCSLIGVSKQGKRSGIGSNLWEQAFTYWKNEGNIEICKVPFSLQNMESFNFHLKMGFNKIEEIKYIYHYSNKL